MEGRVVTSEDDLIAWIAQLYTQPELLRMGHNQRADDLNLGLGWLYYGLARIIRPRHAVVIGSYRGFVPFLIARALADNVEPGEVTFIDPSLVDDFWRDPAAVTDYAHSFGIRNVTHYLATTQEFVETEAYSALDQVGLVFIDGYHSAEQARFDYEAFEPRLTPDGVALFHDSMITRPSEIYGVEARYDIRVKRFIEDLGRDPALQVFDVPFGTGLTIVRRSDRQARKP